MSKNSDNLGEGDFFDSHCIRIRITIRYVEISFSLAGRTPGERRTQFPTQQLTVCCFFTVQSLTSLDLSFSDRILFHLSVTCI